MFLDDGQQANGQMVKWSNGQMGCSFYKIKISSSKLHVSKSQYFFSKLFIRYEKPPGTS